MSCWVEGKGIVHPVCRKGTIVVNLVNIVYERANINKKDLRGEKSLKKACSRR